MDRGTAIEVKQKVRLYSPWSYVVDTDSRTTRVGWMIKDMRADSGFSMRKASRWTAAPPLAFAYLDDVIEFVKSNNEPGD